MVGLTLLCEADAAGLTVWADGDRLRILGPKAADAVARLVLQYKPDVMAVLCERTGRASTTATPSESAPDEDGTDLGDRPVIAPGESLVLHPDHPLADFDWHASDGYCPGRRITRDGVEHKLPTCNSCRSWRHVWGERYCLECWPPTDSLAVAAEDAVD
jgi:hypothetical protein